ncbi:hypothetical protein [Actinomadura nitritigenes]|uniref:hypothetical protein n=1 Tax=Actinomadura nitritigenes TaxID=134602 RepID=UPI003D9308B9
MRRRLAEIRHIRAMSTGGDAIGRDQINITVHRTGIGERWEVRDCVTGDADLAATPSRQMLAAALTRRRVAVLRAGPRSGATTTAIAALSLFAGRIREVAGDRSPASLTAEIIEPDYGYVFEARGAAWATRLHAPAALGCQNLLAERNAWLVIVVAADCATDALDDLLVQHEPPDPLDVLSRHLGALLPDDETATAEALRAADPPPRTPGEAAGLARAVARGLVRGRTVGQVMAERPHPLRAEARSRLSQIRDGQPEERDLVRRAFLIAWSVLHVLPAVHVCRAAQSLAAQLYETEKKKTDAKLGQLPFGAILTAWLGEPAGDPGHDALERPIDVDRRLPMRAGLAEAVLHVVWFDYVVAHDALLHWLGGLAEDSDSRVRALAALALGRLAVYDFDFMAQTCFVAWSRSSRQSLHQVTAWALEETVKREPARLDRVFDVADAWARGRNGAQRSTALRMYGTCLGVQNPERALRGLRQIALKDASALAQPIAMSVAEIFAGGQEPVVVRALAAWCGSPQPHGRRIAAGCLGELARLDDVEGVPQLMALFAEEPALVAGLWRQVLTSRQCGRKPWDALRAWHKRGTDLTGLRMRLEEEPRLRQPLAFYLGSWKPGSRPHRSSIHVKETT